MPDTEEKIDYAVNLAKDLAEQFKEGPHNQALLRAIGRQLDDLYQFFCDLRDKRSLLTAQGKQLDGIGDIVCLTRAQGGELACVTESTYVLDDEPYRDFLVYKIWRNTNDTTYYDIIKSLRIFWDRPIYYREDPEMPACMIFDTGEMEGLVDTRKLMVNPIIRAAGVGYRLSANTVTDIGTSTIRIRSGFRTWSEDHLEWLDRPIDYTASVHWFNGYPTITETQVPAMDRLQSYGAQSSIMETPLGEAVLE